MNGFGSRLIHRAYKVSVNILCHKGNHGRGSFCQSYKSGVEGHVSVDLILRHTADPISFSAATNVPVGKIVNEFLKGSASLGNSVIFKVLIHCFYSRSKTGQKPFIHYGKAFIIKGVLGRIKAVDVGVEHVERVGVPKGTHKLSLSFYHCFAVETVGQPRSGVGIEVPTDGVSTVGFKSIEGVNRVALGFTHFLTVFILNVTQNDNVFVGSLIKDEGRDGKKGIEPTTGLVHCFGNKVRRELSLEEVFVFKGVVVLSEGHCAGVEPAVDYFGNSLHFLTAMGAGEGNCIDVGAVKFNFIGAILAQGFQFFNGADGMTVTAFTFPDI